MLRFSVRIPGKPESSFESRESPLTIGRGVANVLCLDNPHVSTMHARIDVIGARMQFTDVGSTNGSMIQRGEQSIAVQAGGAAVVLEVGDVLVLGDSAAPVLLIIMAQDEDTQPGEGNTFRHVAPTVVAQVPVDPRAGGMTVAIRPNATFTSLPAEVSQHPAVAQSLFELACSFELADLSAIVDAFGAAVFALCPAISHVVVGTGPMKDMDAEVTHHIERDSAGPGATWRTNRVLLNKAISADQAMLVVDRLDEEQEGKGKRSRLLHTGCVPLRARGASAGFVQIDNRRTSQAIADSDLMVVAVLSRLLGVGLATLRGADNPSQTPVTSNEDEQ